MENIVNFGEMQFNLPKNQSNVIKVIGVGGGGSNAVNHMYKKGTDGVDFVICNTDAQALNSSPVPIRIQLGASLTEGLGAGSNPEVGKEAALESRDAIESMLGEKTKMLFITVGMGGGTGTGAAPIIAKIAKDMGLLTVAVVTTPFSFEGRKRNEQAQKGLSELREVVDSIIVINNNKLREVYGNLGFKSGFSKADEVLSTAAMGIAKVITNHFTQNIDFRDANTVLANSGTAIMGSALAEGVNRAQDAITKALDSPLLNDNKIKGAKNVLLLIVSGSDEITIDEIGEINDYIQSEAKTNVNIIMGVGEEAVLGDSIEVTIVATGFNEDRQKNISTVESKKVVYNLEDSNDVKIEDVIKSKPSKSLFDNEIITDEISKITHKLDDDVADKEEKIVHQLEEEKKPLTLFDIEVGNEEFIDRKSVDDVEDDLTDEKGFLGNDFNSLMNDLKEEVVLKENELEIVNEEREFDENTLIPTSEIIKNISVVYDEVITNEFVDSSIEDEFIITTSIADIEVHNIEEVKPTFEKENQMTFVFDMPIASNDKKEEKALKLDKEDVVKKTEVEPEIISDKKVYSLDDYLELENTLDNAKAKNKNSVKTEEVEPELKFETKIISNDSQNNIVSKNEEIVNEEVVEETKISPLNQTISQLKKRTDERRIKMKDYNYKFRKNTKQTIDDLEKQPAYKRNNVELDENPSSNNITRTSLETNGDDITFRSNNSFLHDNVD